MKKIALILGMLLVLSAVVSAAKYNGMDYEPGKIIVKFKQAPTLTNKQINLGGEILNSVSGKALVEPKKQKAKNLVENTYFFNYNPNKDISQVIKNIMKNSNVEWAEPNYQFELLAVPNDPNYSKQWNFPKTGAEKGWDITTGNESILLAAIDTGIDWDHAELDSKVVMGYDFYDSDPDPDDFNGHGTFINGLMGAETNNSQGIAGLCWNCKLYAIRAGSNSIGAMYAYLATVNATDAGARAINYAFESANLSFLINAVQYAYSNGVFIAAAAGNNGNSTPVYPAYYPEIMAVGGRDSSDGRYSSSSYGDWVDISAPAVNLFSTNKNNGYKYGTGTSYAAPQVTGLVGLILSKNPTLTNVQVRQIINDSADYIATDYWVGGRINVTRALQMTPNPPVNNAPVLAAIGNKNVNEGNGLIIDVNATDADNDTLTYYTSASFGSFNSATGVFNWTPGYNDAGIYQVTFNVTDGFLWDSETINITVNNVNRAPVLDFISDKNVNENQIVTIIANATDPDSDLLSYAINDSRFVQNGNTFTWQTNYNSAGIYYVLVSVSDGNGGSDDQVVQVTVNNVQYMLYVNKGGTGSGTVTSIPAGINCGSDCDENYDAGIDVNLTANTAPGSKFMGWSGDCSGNGECIVNIDSISYVSANFALLNLVKDDTEDASSCSGNCHPSWTRGLDENWGSVAADAGNCSGEGRCTPNGVGTGIVEEYNWTNNFLNGNVTLESKYGIRASGRYNVSCYNGASWQELFSDSGTRWPYIITHNITVPSACIITNNPLKIKHTIFGIHPMAPTFYYESRIWYYSL